MVSRNAYGVIIGSKPVITGNEQMLISELLLKLMPDRVSRSKMGELINSVMLGAGTLRDRRKVYLSEEVLRRLTQQKNLMTSVEWIGLREELRLIPKTKYLKEYPELYALDILDRSGLDWGIQANKNYFIVYRDLDIGVGYPRIKYEGV